MYRQMVASIACLVSVSVFLCATGCAGGLVQKKPPGNLDLRLDVEYRRVGTSTHPIAVLEIINAGTSAAAFTKTFGVTNVKWLDLRIETADGVPVYYPREVDIFHVPSYGCLQPGQADILKIDLFDWHVMIGGELDSDESMAFELKPGHYRMRAIYSDGRAVEAPCPGINGTIYSEWVEFQVAN